MIKKLEEELEVKIFDRSRQPVVSTEIGKKIIAQAKLVLHESYQLKNIVQQEQKELSGELRIGIIPTLAPYLLPLFLPNFMKKNPLIKLKISELTTDEITRKLLASDLDVGILATPLQHASLQERPLFYEEFVVYTSVEQKIKNKKYVLAKDLDVNHLWLLEEGHCLRSQVVNLCELKSQEQAMHQLDFAAGCIETLKKMVETNAGITILPFLALQDMTPEQKSNIYYFQSPSPVREIGLVTYRYFVKEKLIDALKKEILLHLPDEMKSQHKKVMIGV